MKGGAASRLWVVRHVAGPRRAATRADPEARVGARPAVLLELQWRGRSGRFRHLAVTPGGLRRVLATSGVVVLLALAVGGALSVRSDRFPSLLGHDPVARENSELKARHAALREQALDAAAQLDERIELGRRMLGAAETPGHAWEDQSLRLPAKDAGDDVVLAWISVQKTRLEALENELAARRVETGGMQASVPTPAARVPASAPGAEMLQVAGLASARTQEAAPTRR